MTRQSSGVLKPFATPCAQVWATWNTVTGPGGARGPARGNGLWQALLSGGPRHRRGKG